jgi:diguanylate cyclase (GGDEF)-like protein
MRILLLIHSFFRKIIFIPSEYRIIRNFTEAPYIYYHVFGGVFFLFFCGFILNVYFDFISFQLNSILGTRSITDVSVWVFIVVMLLIFFTSLGLTNFFMHRSNLGFECEKTYWKGILSSKDSPAVLCNGLHIVEFNDLFSDFLECPEKVEEGLLITYFITDPEVIDRIFSDQDDQIETVINKHHNVLANVVIITRSIQYGDAKRKLLTIKDVSRQKALENKVAFLANHDPITQLPNRTFFLQELDRALLRSDISHKSCCIIKIRIDQFRILSEKHGDAVLDRLLRILAEKLQSDVPTDALVASNGSASFVVLCENLPEAAEARLLGQQIRRLFSHAIELDGQRYDISASVGIATYPDDSHSKDDLLKNASLALASASNEGGGRFKFFTANLHEEVKRKQYLIGQLPKAIDNGDIRPFFQPILHAHNTRVAAFEALVRWNNEELGVISPGEFLPLTEEKGLMMPLTDLMLESAIEAASQWPDDVRVSVNVSPAQLNSELVDRVGQLLKTKAFNPSRLEIEVTEDVLIKDFEHAASMFSRLRALGIQVAMDDFGAGFTSLGNLRFLNFDRIKIDKIFTDDLPNHRRVAAVIKAMLVLAKELDITVTVEGVETEEQFTFLKGEGCAEVQGFLFSAPRPLDKLSDLPFLHIPQKVAPLPILKQNKKLLA